MKKVLLFIMVLGLSSLAHAGPEECDRSVDAYAALLASTAGPDEKIGVAHFYSKKMDKCFVILSYESTSGAAYTIAAMDKEPVEGDMDKLYAVFVWMHGEASPRTCFVWGNVPCASKEEWLDLEKQNRPL